MALTNPPKNWVVRYRSVNNPTKYYNFAGWKEDNHPKYAIKFDNIQKYATAEEAYKILVELSETGEYLAEVKRICIAVEDAYYFI